MKCEEPVKVYTPKRFFNHGDPTIDQASELIHASAVKGLMLEHSPRELRRMAKLGRIKMLVRETPEGRKVVGVAGVTKVHRPRFTIKTPLKSISVPKGRIIAAELGALATHPDYTGNGYGPEITRTVAESYLRQGFLTRFWQSPDVRLFAMAAQTNVVSNGMFDKVGGVRIDQSVLPEVARDPNYNAFDITHLGRRAVVTAQTVI